MSDCGHTTQEISTTPNVAFPSTDRRGFLDYSNVPQPWKRAGVTFLRDVEKPDAYDPYAEDSIDTKEIKLLYSPGAYDDGTGGLGGH
ncbi:hypothetical protein SMACR_07008 [Sordaria macrospora]|uniref:WGS project CABT00000000 data, contig 2.29 n=2 Tax=Sordaria macrospora TaxID=5147 RepID=F7W513_SORMK|nr:uncharacterized protein SMAC_07008 [Sordaria macrospora k-hell]KAA8632137.1 hypothetical protein SMACR_07008 [Sordaria macrospora]WPJ67171.1 hypothetical protein SMAC4_07008 [Sordaria macrospora]CCC12601.1 unnamed protein product [Sordaria macrospora k-hell]